MTENAKQSTQAVVLFHSTSHAIRAERLLIKAQVPCKMIPVPRHLSADCGICLRFSTRRGREIAGILQEKKIVFDGPVTL